MVIRNRIAFETQYKKDFNEEKTHCAINHPKINRLNHITSQLYEIELDKPENENKKSIIFGFFRT